MKRFITEELLPGMVTAQPVCTHSGQLIMNSGVTLTNRLIERIDFYSIKNVMIEDDSPLAEAIDLVPNVPDIPNMDAALVNIPQTEDVPNPSYSQKIKQSPKFKEFQSSYNHKIEDVKGSLDDILTSESINSTELLNDTMLLLNTSSLNTIELFDMLHNMRQVDDSIYAHSLNVSLIARVLGKWLKLSNEDIDNLTLAGLLHDIGKIKIPSSILNKPGPLSDSEFNIVKMHPKLGYDSLLNTNLPLSVKQAVLMHHERCDGSGYPLGLTTNQLDDFSMIIAIADVYDAMTAARAYRKPLCPFQVIASFENDGLQKYNPHFILTFLERIANTYQHNRVLLSNGCIGTIVLLNQSHLSHPTLQMDDGTFLDLSTHHDLSIVAVV
ncbi:MAG: HD-GYP domain-containing protein [Lachnospiraceae bacterium]